MTSSKGRESSSNNAVYGIVVAAAIVLCGISFWSGTAYQKSKKTTAVVADNNPGSQTLGTGTMPGGGQGGPRSGQRPNIGEVTAISSDSITIQDSLSNSKKTFKITSSTTVQNNGSTATASDIKSGDTALVVASSSDASTASQITLNPSFGGQQPGDMSQ